MTEVEAGAATRELNSELTGTSCGREVERGGVEQGGRLEEEEEMSCEV